MSEVTDVDPDLRSLARRVPVETRAAMTAFELAQRCEYASSILAEADETGDTVKADRLRSRAGQVLRACSPATYAAEKNRLEDELSKARLNQDARGEYQAIEDMRLLARRHPQPDPERVAMAGLMAAADFVESYVKSQPANGKLPPIPPPMPPDQSALTRRFGRSKKGKR